VTLERGVVAARQLGRRHHHRLGAHLLRAAAIGNAAVGAGVRRADANRKRVARHVEHDLGDAIALRFGELVGLAEHAEDRHAVDPRAARELGEFHQAGFIERSIRAKRRRRNVVNAGQILKHQNLKTLQPQNLKPSRPTSRPGTG
jgi:hypothetical protein